MSPAGLDAPLTNEDFVRAFPPGMPVAEAMAVAESMGMNMTFGELIEAMSAAPRPTRLPGKQGARRPVQQADAEVVELISRVGLDRVEQVLARVKAGLDGMRRGR